jgi:hypothetical protein
MQPKNIQEVIDALSEIIETANEKGAVFGYFACLYRKMTIAVQQGIANNVFEDGARMEALDVIFAQRYLDAYLQMSEDKTPSNAWNVAFEAAKSNQITVLQHLLLGINAHINLDLGIAAAQTCSGETIYSLKNDFDKINTVISTISGEVQNELAEIWFPLRFINQISNKTNDAVINFSIEIARNSAWKVATDLAFLSNEAQLNYINTLDNNIANLAQKIIFPPFKDSVICKIVKFFELKSPIQIMKILS